MSPKMKYIKRLLSRYIYIYICIHIYKMIIAPIHPISYFNIHVCAIAYIRTYHTRTDGGFFGNKNYPFQVVPVDAWCNDSCHLRRRETTYVRCYFSIYTFSTFMSVTLDYRPKLWIKIHRTNSKTYV